MRDDQASRLAQISAMAHPDRVTIAGLIISAPGGDISAEELAGAGGDTRSVETHLDLLVDAKLLTVDAGRYRPTPDLLLRFGRLVTVAERSDSAAPTRPADSSLEPIIRELELSFQGTLSPATVRGFVLESYELLAARATVRRFLPQLTSRFAADRLAAVASIESGGATAPTDVLFVCVRNAGRSQIAAAFLRSMAGVSVRVRTAGSAPSANLDPVVRAELSQLGLDHLTEFPRPLTPEVIRASGVVVTMGCGEACPFIPGRRYVDWPVDDPAGQDPIEVRRIIEEIRGRVKGLVEELGIAAQSE